MISLIVVRHILLLTLSRPTFSRTTSPESFLDFNRQYLNNHLPYRNEKPTVGKVFLLRSRSRKKATKKHLKYHGYMTKRWRSRVSRFSRQKLTALRLWSSYEARSFSNRSAAASCTSSKTLWVAMATAGAWIHRRGCGNRDRSRATSRVRTHHVVVSEPSPKLKTSSFRAEQDLSNDTLIVKIRSEMKSAPLGLAGCQEWTTESRKHFQ